MHKPESILENEIHKILWNFAIRTDPLILRPDQVNLPYRGFCRPSRPQSENQRKRKERQIPGPCLRTKKAEEHKDDGDTNCNWRAWNGP